MLAAEILEGPRKALPICAVLACAVLPGVDRLWPGEGLAWGHLHHPAQPRGTLLSPWEVRVDRGLSHVLGDYGGPDVVARSGGSPAEAASALPAGGRTCPALEFTCPSDEVTAMRIEMLFRRSGWIFLVLEPGRVLALSKLQVEQPGPVERGNSAERAWALAL